MLLSRQWVTPLLLITGVGCSSPSGSSSDGFAEEPTGSIVFIWQPAGDGRREPYRIRPDGTGFAPITVPTPGATSPETSRNGERLLYKYAGDLFVLDFPTGGLRQVTTDWHNSWPSWSPDGNRVVSVNRNYGDWGYQALLVTEIDRSAERTITPPLSPYEGFLTQPVFFPSGDSLLYVKHNGGGEGWLWLAYAEGRPTRPFTSPFGQRVIPFALSRDGRRFAASSTGSLTDTTRTDDYIVRIARDWVGPGQSVDFSPNYASALSFSPDGKFLVVTVTNGGVGWLEILEVSTLRRRRITPEGFLASAWEAKWGP